MITPHSHNLPPTLRVASHGPTEAFREIMMKARRQRMGLPAEAGLRFVLVFFGGPFSLPFLFGGGLVFFVGYPWDERYIYLHLP